jgi:ribosome-binding factor A
MSESRRVQRVERELREIIGTHLLTGLNFSLEGMVTLTRVTVSADLRSARAFLTMMMANEKAQLENLKLLNANTKELQHRIHTQLPMKYCPKVRFEIDKGFENVQIVEARLREIKKAKDESNEESE